jgi:hypothetical protein
MARDPGLEQVLGEQLRDIPNLSEKALFGGRAWLMEGNLMCGARDDGVLIRLGKGNDAWALEIEGIEQMISRGRLMAGWVRVSPMTFGDERLAQRLIDAAARFVRTLPSKQ